MFGLIDYSVDKVENGLWQVHRTEHRKPSPGDEDPEGRWLTEWRTKNEAVKEARRLARVDIDHGVATQTAVFVEGDEVLFLSREKRPRHRKSR